MIKRLGVALFFIVMPLSAAQAAGPYCKDYSTCEQAVRNWCSGKHARADGDDDGIPCENVCKSLADVKAIQASIGCTK